MSVSRLFVEIGQNVDRMNASLRQAITTAQEAGVKVTASGQSILSKFDDALNPTKKLTEQIQLLEKAGKSQADIQKVMGDQIAAAAQQARAMGQPIDDLIRKYTSLESQLKATGEKMLSFGKSMSMYVTAPIMAIGAGFVAAAGDINEGMIKIRTGTGAAGDQLAALGQNFRNVFHDVPDSAKEVGTAIADLSTRLGLTGKPLEDMANQMLNLARLTGTQVGPIVAATTRLFGDWSVSTDKQSETLDYMFKVTQKTGIGIQSLTELTVQYGAPLRALGFSLEQGAAMLGKWEKEGVNMETVLAGMRFALGNFAKAGKDPVEALIQIQNAIKGAKTESEATAIAFQAFGKRAAADMGRAIIEGRFNIDELMKSIKASKSTINETEEANKTFAESMFVIKHRAEEALEPLGNALVKALKSLTPSIESAVKWFSDLVKGFADMDPWIQKTVIGFAAAAAAIGPLTVAIGGITTAVGSILGVIGGEAGLLILMNPFAQAIAVAGAAFFALSMGIKKTEADIENLKQSMLPASQMSAEMAARAKLVEDRLASQGVVINKVGLSVEEYTRQLAYADDDMKNLNARLGDGASAWDRYTVMFNKGATATGAAGNVTKELTEEQQKLLDKWNESIKPLDALTKEFEKQAEVGADLNRWAQVHREQILKATEAQREFGEPIAGNARSLQNMAEALKKIEGVKADTIKTILESAYNPLTGQGAQSEVERLNLDNLAMRTGSISSAIDTMIEQMNRQVLSDMSKSLGKLPGVTDDSVKKMQEIIADYLGWVDKTDNEVFVKNWEEHNKAALESSKSSAKQMREVIDSTFSDMERGIAQAIVHWKGFGETLKSIFQDLGAGMLRILEQKLFDPLEKWFSKIIDSIMGLFKGGSFSAGTSGGIFSGLSSNKLLTGSLGLGTGGAGIYESTQQSGASSWISGLGGGAAAGAGFAMLFPALMSGPWGAAIGAAAFALSKGIGSLINLAQGKNAWEAGSPEAFRDFKVTLSQDQFKSFASDLGLSESSTYPIRKELLSSPLALTQLLGPLAQANGQTDKFLQSLEHVSTAWGDFNLRAAYESGLASGNFSELNRVWTETIGKSSELARIMPNFATQLAAVAGAGDTVDAVTQALTEGFTDLKTAISGSLIPAETMYSTFLKTGDITTALADKIKDLGGSLEAFQNYADLSKQLKPLQDQLTFITQLKDAIAGLAPDLDPIKALLSGNMNESVIASLTVAGLDYEKLSGLTGMIGMETGWEKSVGNLQNSGTLSPELKQALLQYGGGAGQTAVEQFGQGFNTISESLLESTKAAMDAAYKSQITNTLDYLGSMQEKTTDAITQLQTAISDAAADVIVELDKILGAISVLRASPTTVTGVPGGDVETPGTDTGTGDRSLPGGAETTGSGNYYDLRGATIYGYEDFNRRVEEAEKSNAKRRGYGYVYA